MRPNLLARQALRLTAPSGHGRWFQRAQEPLPSPGGGGKGPRAHVKPRTHNCVIQVVHIHVRARSQAGILCAFPSSILISVTAMQPAMTYFIRPRFAILSLVCPFFANESTETRRGDRTTQFDWRRGILPPGLSSAILHRTPTTARLKHPSKHSCLSTFPSRSAPKPTVSFYLGQRTFFTSAPARARFSDRMKTSPVARVSKMVAGGHVLRSPYQGHMICGGLALGQSVNNFPPMSEIQKHTPAMRQQRL
jgi:hypothetical protein